MAAVQILLDGVRCRTITFLNELSSELFWRAVSSRRWGCRSRCARRLYSCCRLLDNSACRIIK